MCLLCSSWSVRTGNAVVWVRSGRSLTRSFAVTVVIICSSFRIGRVWWSGYTAVVSYYGTRFYYGQFHAFALCMWCICLTRMVWRWQWCVKRRLSVMTVVGFNTWRLRVLCSAPSVLVRRLTRCRRSGCENVLQAGEILRLRSILRLHRSRPLERIRSS
ncbi:uncharacterized protein MYCGRDRAFT_105573, partial [Zymoseptoria tritici IPO323]